MRRKSRKWNRVIIWILIWLIGIISIDVIINKEGGLVCHKVDYTYYSSDQKRIKNLENKIDKVCMGESLGDIKIQTDIVPEIQKRAEVRSYRIIKQYPYLIKVHLYMRKPYLYVETKTGVYVYDKEAVPFKFYESLVLSDVQKDEDKAYNLSIKGGYLEENLGEVSKKVFIKTMIKVAEKMKNQEQEWQVKSMKVLHDESYFIELKKGLKVYLGKHEVLKRVNKLIHLISNKEDKMKIAEELDMRFGAIVIKKK